MSNAERLIEILGPDLSLQGAVADEASIDRLAASLGGLAEEDFVCQMISVGDVKQTATGVDGLRAVLKDWIEMFSEMRLEVEDVEEHGDNVLVVATQIGVTRHGDVEIEQPSAVVWKFRQDLIYRVEWHLDRGAAERSAGSG